MKWNKVSIKMPKENNRNQSNDVLVLNDAGEMQVGYTLEGYWQDYNGERNITVTHWRKLPKAPK